MLRKWTPKNSKFDPEIMRLEEEAHRTRMDIHRLREHGRQMRLQRLESLDALETKRMTMTEILRRLEKEMKDKDVYDYGDVLAEVFGERKIFAHRAIGLEALLCQFMHQMLAKQHQLKIMKRAAKDIQQIYKQNFMQNRDEFHSYEALAIQLEASRLSLETMYEDVFESQHKILARLLNGGPLPPPNPIQLDEKITIKPKPPLAIDVSPLKNSKVIEQNDMPLSTKSSEEKDDYASAMDVLTSPNPHMHAIAEVEHDTAEAAAAAVVAAGQHRTPTKFGNRFAQQRVTGGDDEKLDDVDFTNDGKTPKAKGSSRVIGRINRTNSNSPDNGSPVRKRNLSGNWEMPRRSPTVTSSAAGGAARERRRQIEQMREQMLGGASRDYIVDDGSVSSMGSQNQSARRRMRELEQQVRDLEENVRRRSSTRKSADFPPSHLYLESVDQTGGTVVETQTEPETSDSSGDENSPNQQRLVNSVPSNDTVTKSPTKENDDSFRLSKSDDSLEPGRNSIPKLDGNVSIADMLEHANQPSDARSDEGSLRSNELFEKPKSKNPLLAKIAAQNN